MDFFSSIRLKSSWRSVLNFRRTLLQILSWYKCRCLHIQAGSLHFYFCIFMDYLFFSFHLFVILWSSTRQSGTFYLILLVWGSKLGESFCVSYFLFVWEKWTSIYLLRSNSVLMWHCTSLLAIWTVALINRCKQLPILCHIIWLMKYFWRLNFSCEVHCFHIFGVFIMLKVQQSGNWFSVPSINL